MKHAVDKTQVFNCRAFGTCTVFEGDPRTRTLRSANGDGLNILIGPRCSLLTCLSFILFKNGRPIRLCLLGTIGLHDGSMIFSVLPY